MNMIIYTNQMHAGCYKKSSIVGFDFIRPKTSTETRPTVYSLRNLTAENSDFLKKLGLKLKK